jgi:galactokinase
MIETKAHGRVNLIGEHTDYNGGFVLPTCIPQFTRAQLKRRDDGLVVCRSRDFQGEGRYTLGAEKKTREWYDYVQGVTFVLRGRSIGGFECDLESTVPVGSGLSSSAALEVALLKGLNELFGLGLTAVEIAQLGQKVENDFVGARVGIMDQMVSSLGTSGEALFIDTRDLSVKRIAVPHDDVELLVISSGIQHSNAHGGYNERRSQCEEACRLLGVNQLRDLGLGDLDRLATLPLTIAKRARHVITENARVLDAVRALESRDYETLGKLFLASHASMRDDYAVSVPGIDLLVELCMSHSPVYGARLTGGGFGGSIVALVRRGFAAEVAELVGQSYGERTQHNASILVPKSSIRKV